MKLSLYQVDAFAKRTFEGNPAAVVPLDNWLPDQTMQLVAAENNLSETAFFVPASNNSYHIRWFTPKAEVALCGHATLASAYVLFEILGFEHSIVHFESLSGVLSVEKCDNLLSLNFPSSPPVPCSTPQVLIDALGLVPKMCASGEDYLVELDSEADLQSLEPRFDLLMQLDKRGVIATAPSENYDFVVRFFAPKYGINEDPVTGSAYTQAAPYWDSKLNKRDLSARQISQRGGDVYCRIEENRVAIQGYAKKYLEGEIFIHV